jgi:hypothetical protein
MTLFEITPQTSLRTAAVVYLMQGFSVIPLKGKQASVPWTVYQQQRARTSDLSWWDTSGLLKNIGIICGAVSNNLVVMDLDGEWAVKTFEDLFPNLLDTFTVATGSGRGKHLYFFVDEPSPSKKHSRGEHSGIEMRANGSYVAAPPSVHPDTGKPYEISVKRPIRKLPYLGYIETWIDGLNHQQKPAPVIERREVRTKGFVDPSRIANPQAWTNAAVRNETRAVQGTPEGSRNDRLNEAAYNLGQIVGLGWLGRNAAQEALLTAARAAGLSEAEALHTIQSGLKKGIDEPRDAQWQKRRS